MLSGVLLSIVLVIMFSIWWNRSFIRKLHRIYKLINGVNVGNQDNLSRHSVGKTGDYIEIPYLYASHEMKMLIPYRGELLSFMTNLSVVAIAETGENAILTHQPGIPYLVTARQLGAKSIVATNCLTGESRAYLDDQVPNYCEELYSDE